MEIEFVCIGNYCRSPVAEKILKKHLPNCTIYSSGVSPMSSNNMHKFSRRFLEDNNFTELIHIPNQFNFQQNPKIKKILCFEPKIINLIWEKSPHLKNSLFSFTKYFQNEKVYDPLNYEKQEYFIEMQKILEITIDWSKRLK